MKTRYSPRSYIELWSWLFAALTLFVLLAGAVLLLKDSVLVWKHEGTEILTGKEWFYRSETFGAAAMIYGTLIVAVLALLIAAPLGIGAAICTVEYLPARWRMVIKTMIEMLAGIPSVVYGLLGILILRNWIYQLFEDFEILSGDTLLTAGILLGVMILPTVMTLADDALSGVARAQRIAARGLGLNATDTIFSVSLPQALPGLIAALLLALGRAMGETIAVFLVIGRQDNQWPGELFSLRPLVESGQTLSSKLGGAEINIAYGQPLHWSAMVGLSFLLLLLVVGLTLLGLWIREHSKHTSYDK